MLPAFRSISLIFALALTAPLSTAHAQSALEADEAERHTDRARTLFTDGVALVAEGRFEEAEAHFRQALELHDAPSIRVNLASVLVEQGEYPEAMTLAQGVVDDAAAPDASRESARVLLEHMRTQAGYVRVPDAGNGVVSVDEVVLPDPTHDTPVAPGAHVATLRHGGVEQGRRPFEIASGDHLTLSFDMAPVEEAVAPEGAPSRSIASEWWFWTIIGGVVVAGVVVGVVVGVTSSTTTVQQSPVLGDFEPGVLRW